MAAAVKTMTWAERRARCLELARQHHLDGTSWEVGLPDVHPDVHGVERLRVPSADRRREYILTHHLPSDSWWCPCEAGRRGRPCGHVGAAIDHHLRRERALREAGLTFEQWVEGQRATRAWLAASSP